MKLYAHVNYGGNCEEAFRFYERHLGGKINAMIPHASGPRPDNAPPGWEKAIVFAQMSIGETMLRGNDVPPDRFQPVRSVYIALVVDSSAEAERIYALLADGGQVFMPMGETFFALRFGQLRDRFGTSWMILHERPMPVGSSS